MRLTTKTKYSNQNKKVPYIDTKYQNYNGARLNADSTMNYFTSKFPVLVVKIAVTNPINKKLTSIISVNFELIFPAPHAIHQTTDYSLP